LHHARTVPGRRTGGKSATLRHRNWLVKKLLVEPINRINVNSTFPMATAAQVHRSLQGASFTKAQQCVGTQHMLRQCRPVSIWVSKLTDAGCLA